MSIKYRNGLGKGDDGYYHYCFKMKRQVYKDTTGATSIEVAREILKKIKDDLGLELAGAPRMKVITLDKLLDEWESQNTGVLTKAHMVPTLCKLRLHCGPIMKTPINIINKAKVEGIRKAYLEVPGHSAGGANSLVKSLKGVLGWAIGQYLKVMPFRLKRIKVQRKPRRVIPLKDTEAFLAALEAPYPFTGVKHCPKARPKNPHAIMACRLMLGLGLREIEALGARWEWFDWTTKTYYAGKTKNGEARIIPIPDYLVELLEAWPARVTEGLVLPGKPHPKDPEKKPLPHTGQFTKKVLARAGKDLGIPGLTPHRLRATFATNHARAGTDLDDIRIMLGHSDIATTMVYIESFTDRLAERQNRVAELQGLNKPKPVTPRLPDGEEAAC